MTNEIGTTLQDIIEAKASRKREVLIYLKCLETCMKVLDKKFEWHDEFNEIRKYIEEN